MSLLSHIPVNQEIAIRTKEKNYSFQDLHENILALSAEIKLSGATRIGLYGDNSATWLMLDLAALHAQVTLVPLPTFFSDEQVRHAVDSADIDLIISINDSRLKQLLKLKAIDNKGDYAFLYIDKPGYATPLPGIAKVTYTSGSTGNPKGVCLSAAAMLEVAESIAEISEGDVHDQHISLLPFSTLLENVAGLYASLISCATLNILPLADVGISGSSQLSVENMYASLLATKATTAITTPQLLQQLVFYMQSTSKSLPDMRFIAVGGSTLSPQILQQAVDLGLPVYEGYGLSEACSVVSCNSRKYSRNGSVGKLLPHADVKIAPDNEILVAGSTFDGYLGDRNVMGDDRYWPTGDLGYIDGDYLHIKGRKKNIIISSYGRNISPEWIEAELTSEPSILQAAVFGDGQPFLCAVIFSSSPQQALQAIENINQQLPDYARIYQPVFSPYPFTKENGCLTDNGRIRRLNIATSFEHEINRIYESEQCVGEY